MRVDQVVLFLSISIAYGSKIFPVKLYTWEKSGKTETKEELFRKEK